MAGTRPSVTGWAIIADEQAGLAARVRRELFRSESGRSLMTDAAIRLAETPGSLPAHPLDPATAGEFKAGREIMAGARLLTESTRFAYYGLEEPPKDDVLAYTADAGAGTDAGQSSGPDRRLRAFLIDVVTGESADVVVSVTQHKVIASRTLDPLTDGQVPILDQDFALAEEIVHADPGWRAAMARRGLTDVTKIRACPLPAGSYGIADEQARRMVRVLAFVQAREHDLAWAHPVDGVAAYVDLIERRVFKLVDELDLPVPQQSGDYDDPAVRGPPASSRSRSPSRKGRVSPWTVTGWSGRAGRCGSASTPARASPCTRSARPTRAENGPGATGGP